MILPLEKQVASLDLCKRLKELGVDRDSLFYWQQRDGEYSIIFDNSGMTGYTFWIHAYTVAELGEMLPKDTVSFRSDECCSDKLIGPWCCRQRRFGVTKQRHGHTEADCRASLLIALLESHIVKAEEVSK